jgi:[ribosomal protein S18]-alanine N-acetyltransferase
MTPAYAAEVATWRYPPPYDYNDMTGADPAYLASPGSGYFALTDATGLIGYRCFGAEGQVPGGSYDDQALDTGGGLRPDLTGRGLGREAISTGLDFGRERFQPQAFRLTVATFNLRAQRVITALGFYLATNFRATTDGRDFGIWLRREPVGRPGD